MSIKRGLACGLLGLSALLTACGGGGSDNAVVATLPARVDITGAATAEVDAPTAFATTLTGPTDGLTFAWSFGDGSSSSAAAPSHSYAAGGDYAVTLTVTSPSGATRNGSFTVTASRLAMVQGSTCTGAANTGWCWQRPRPTGNAMLDVFFIDASTGWAVGEAGQILKTIDGGASWVGQRSGVSSRLTQVRFANAGKGWALGDSGTALTTTDGGATWTPQALGLNSSYYFGDSTLVVLDASRAVMRSPLDEARTTVDGGEHWMPSVLVPSVTTRNGTMWSVEGTRISKSTDLGATASVALQPGSSDIVLGLDFADDAHGWAFGIDTTASPFAQVLWRTADGGATWQRLVIALPSVYSINTLKFTGTQVGWIQLGYEFYRSTDAGANWALVPLPAGLPTGAYVAAPIAFDDTTFWLPYASGGYLTRDGGTSWTALKVDTETQYANPRLQLVGAAALLHFGGRSYRSTDSGASWQQVLGQDVQDQNGSLLASWFFDGKRGLAVSSAGWLVQTSDAGLSWTRKTLTGLPNFGPARLQFTSSTTGWLLADANGHASISRTTDGGASWLAPSSTVDFNGTNDFHFIDGQSGWAVTGAGAINHSIDGGLSWTAQATLPFALRGVRFASATVGVVVGTAGRIARTTDGGATWTLRASGVVQDLNRVIFVDSLNGWAVGPFGTVVKSTDAGATWAKVAVPGIGNLNDIAFADAQHGWVVGDGGTVMVTADGGRSWALQNSGSGMALSSVFFIDARSGWLVGSGGSVLATATGGN